jgi:hypothetical protein
MMYLADFTATLARGLIKFLLAHTEAGRIMTYRNEGIPYGHYPYPLVHYAVYFHMGIFARTPTHLLLTDITDCHVRGPLICAH